MDHNLIEQAGAQALHREVGPEDNDILTSCCGGGRRNGIAQVAWQEGDRAMVIREHLALCSAGRQEAAPGAGRAPSTQGGLSGAWRSSEAGSLGRVSYGQPARGAGASVATTSPVRGSANNVSGPPPPVALMHNS